MQRIRSTNNQYVEENERLRVKTNAYSFVVGKLEPALELERMSNLELQKKVTTVKNQTDE
ncbi:hypothetical protein RND71_012374 [Anisodus tanguticus]|uniref:Uncharacterized protein n=1 Tax=Anisodus tanguticus TaxID=243964 RepID=A0AAE1SFM1_9SOLA|nr:hypothetical protein RND71_012374 [Anisodus tanguticus]